MRTSLHTCCMRVRTGAGVMEQHPPRDKSGHVWNAASSSLEFQKFQPRLDVRNPLISGEFQKVPAEFQNPVSHRLRDSDSCPWNWLEFSLIGRVIERYHQRTVQQLERYALFPSHRDKNCIQAPCDRHLTDHLPCLLRYRSEAATYCPGRMDRTRVPKSSSQFQQSSRRVPENGATQDYRLVPICSSEFQNQFQRDFQHFQDQAS